MALYSYGYLWPYMVMALPGYGHVVTACIVMALYSYGLYSYGLCSYGWLQPCIVMALYSYDPA